ncbi:MAG: fimbrillin family protein, partial [Candidatus Cryptobacteroides sp.]|nr:fimbrillin family protein [Candidatus Cryptobacteroides sp.]
GEQVYYNGGANPKVINYVDLTAEVATVPALTSNDTQNLYLPQTFDENGNEVTIQYTITTKEGSSISKDVVTKTFSLNPSSGTPVFTTWEPGKKYTCTLTFSLDEITWDPAVQDWDPVTAAGITIQ